MPAPTKNVIDEWFADRSGEVIVKDQEVFAGNYEELCTPLILL